jgi:hypothetical protein
VGHASDVGEPELSMEINLVKSVPAHVHEAKVHRVKETEAAAATQ